MGVVPVISISPINPILTIVPVLSACTKSRFTPRNVRPHTAICLRLEPISRGRCMVQVHGTCSAPFFACAPDFPLRVHGTCSSPALRKSLRNPVKRRKNDGVQVSLPFTSFGPFRPGENAARRAADAKRLVHHPTAGDRFIRSARRAALMAGSPGRICGSRSRNRSTCRTRTDSTFCGPENLSQATTFLQELLATVCSACHTQTKICRYFTNCGFRNPLT